MLRLCLLFAAIGCAATAVAQPLVIVAKPTTPVEVRYIAFLQQRLEERHVAHAPVASQPVRTSGSVVVGTVKEVRDLLTLKQYHAWQAADHPAGDEGFAVTSVPTTDGGKALVLTANTSRGELFAIGWLLRTADMHAGQCTLPDVHAFVSAPEKAIRGYQIGYRMKNNTYDAWTLAQFQQQMLDMAVFGLNTMQVVSPVSDDDATSPLFPEPPEKTVIGLSRMSQDYGLRFDLFYPEMAKDYTDPAQVAAELKQFESLVRKLPLVDSIHVPGGDPGHTAPEALLTLLQKEAAILHRYHPAAKVWLSAQGFTAERYARFYQMMEREPDYIDGIFFGPQSRESMEQQRARLPRKYPLEFYPDTAHTMHAQFPVPQWDPVYQLTESREPICPRPAQFEHIYKHFNALNSGFIVYSEGVNDDVNKILWGGWGWNVSRPTRDMLRDYARYFFVTDNKQSDAIGQSIEDLEKNWSGPLLKNTSIESTLASFEKENPPAANANWRWDSLLYRASYDRYLQLKRARELAEEQQAIQVLASANSDFQERSQKALSTLEHGTPDAEEQRLRRNLGLLAAALFHEVGMQLSVKLYDASNWERGANFDRVDTPLNDRIWIERQLRKAAAATQQQQKAAILHTITHWTQPVPGTLYDDLGNPQAESHLVREAGWERDPELYHSAIDGIADMTLEKGWRMSWLTYGETLYEQPLQLHYQGLPTGVDYQVRITYAGEEYKLPMELRANGLVLQKSRLRTSNPEEVEYALPANVLHGELTLEWRRPYGAGGGGRGGQVAEVWLIPQLKSQVAAGR